MAFEACFEDLMHDVIVVANPTGLDNYGRPSGFGANVNVICRLQLGDMYVRNFHGESATSVLRAFCKGDVDVREDSRITLPDGTTPPVFTFRKYPDEAGDIHHTVLFFGTKVGARA